MSCRTPWCYGDCEDCLAEKKEEENREARRTCPESGGRVLASECGIKSVSVKQDACNKCGYVFNYP